MSLSATFGEDSTHFPMATQCCLGSSRHSEESTIRFTILNRREVRRRWRVNDAHIFSLGFDQTNLASSTGLGWHNLMSSSKLNGLVAKIMLEVNNACFT